MTRIRVHILALRDNYSVISFHMVDSQWITVDELFSDIAWKLTSQIKEQLNE